MATLADLAGSGCMVYIAPENARQITGLSQENSQANIF
jgi:hypothetical protein